MDTTKLNEMLTRHVADAAMLAAEAKAWHWSVTGENFKDLHDLFDDVTAHARAATDEIAERMVQLDGVPPAFPQEWIAHGSLDAPPGGHRPDADGMLEHLNASLERISEAVRSDVAAVEDMGDPATVDVLVGWLRDVDKDRWMVRAHRA